MKALNIFNILCFMYKCKQKQNKNQICTPKWKFYSRSSMPKEFFSQHCISYRGSYLWNKIVISKNLTFSDSDSRQAFKGELKRFLLSVELNDLEILK